MSQHLKPKQLQAVYLLAEGRGAMAIAKKLKIRRETLSRWRQNPAFMRKYEQVIGEIQANLQPGLIRLANAAVEALIVEIGSNYGNPKRISGAILVLNLLGVEQSRCLNGDYANNSSNAERNALSSSRMLTVIPSAASEVTP